MQKTAKSNIMPMNRLTIDTAELQALLGCGRVTAIQTGEAAAARVQIGRRVLWNVDKIRSYLNSISE